jgi:PPOX class F420-dependent enzyme/OxyR family protein
MARSFSTGEIAYLDSQRLGRRATVGRDRTPQVVPVGFRFNRDLGTIDVGGHGMGGTKKFADVAREGRVAIVVDDVLPPWRPRGSAAHRWRAVRTRLVAGADPDLAGASAGLGHRVLTPLG